MSQINGVFYTRKQTEYQYFPEDYFSGADVTLYFGDIFVDDITGLEFALQERVLPVYGYNSYTYDSVARGQRLVQGSFTIAFREAGYIYRILEHLGLGAEKAKPLIAYQLSGTTSSKPQWLGNIKETIEELLDRSKNPDHNPYTIQQGPQWQRDLYLGVSGNDVRELQQFFLSSSNQKRYKGIQPVIAIQLTSDMKRNTQSNEVKLLKKRLNEYLYSSPIRLINTPLNESSPTFDSATEQAVKLFQRNFSKTLAVDGIVGPNTRAALNAGLQATGVFDAPTRLTVMRFQAANGLMVDGIVGPQTRSKISITVQVKPDKTSRPSEAEFSVYESSIWGEQSNYDPAFKSSPYFYGSKNQTWLRTEGFDIYINYGPLPEAIAQNGIQDRVNFHTTVRAIRGVQIQSVSQVLNPDGQPIAERYTFIARDLD